MKTGIDLITEERQRQIDVEGYSAQHDSQHNASDFVYAAISYAESEDERIRKALINLFATHKDYEMFFGVAVEDIRAWLEKQKPTNDTDEEIVNAVKDISVLDMVKPKFNVGDWIVDNHGIVNQVTSTTDDGYGLALYDGTYVSGCWKDYYHLWTIQDAKDGDVLVDEDNNIGIYKEIEGLCWHSYIYLGCDNHLRGFSIGGSHIKNNTKPATKEQRDLLFQTMKEKGYELDADKKELKKINSYCQENCKGYQETGKCFADGGCDAKRKAEQKSEPAWSEEDEFRFNCTVGNLKLLNDANGDILHKDIDWLNSIKDRLSKVKNC